MKKFVILIFILFFLIKSEQVFAYQPKLIYPQKGEIFIDNITVSQMFFDFLSGEPRVYLFNLNEETEVNITILVPYPENAKTRYSYNIFLIKEGKEEKIASSDGFFYDWELFYEDFARDYYLKGPTFSQKLLAGEYKIEVFSKNNFGKYTLKVGSREVYDPITILNLYWQLPLLKINFFRTSPFQFLFTLWGIIGISALGVLIILLTLFNYFFGLVKRIIFQKEIKTILLTSSGMEMKEEIKKLLQKPAYNVNVAFIITGAKPKQDWDYVRKNWRIMKEEMGFNIEEIDIEGKSPSQLMNLLSFRDIIYVEGGDGIYLLDAMRRCKFEKIIKKLLKRGKVYIGAGEGSVVAGRTIKTLLWKENPERLKEILKEIKNLKALNLLPYDIFVHYRPEDKEIILKNFPSPRKRKKLKILTDEQALLYQSGETVIIGKGDEIVL